MTKQNDGGPAFPCEKEPSQKEKQMGFSTLQNHEGMSLRDWFAGMALSAMRGTDSKEEICEWAYGFADFMLKERDKNNAPKE